VVRRVGTGFLYPAPDLRAVWLQPRPQVLALAKFEVHRL